MAIIGNIDKIEHFLKNKNLKVVFDYLQEALQKGSIVSKRINALPVGSFQKQQINDTIFAIEQVFYTKKREECFLESHQKYIDFQLVLSGSEMMECVDKDTLEIDSAYDPSKDLITYKRADATSKILLQTQDLAIYFPDDAHMGLALYQAPQLVHKTVVKVPLDLWTGDAD